VECHANRLDQWALALSVQTEAGLITHLLALVFGSLGKLMPDLIEIELLNIPRPFHAELFPELSFLLDLHVSSQCPPNYPSTPRNGARAWISLPAAGGRRRSEIH
jgi:hypothetical protein